MRGARCESRLRMLRETVNLNRDEFAASIGVKGNQIVKLETGQRRMTKEIGDRIELVYGVGKALLEGDVPSDRTGLLGELEECLKVRNYRLGGIIEGKVAAYRRGLLERAGVRG